MISTGKFTGILNKFAIEMAQEKNDARKME
jgi:hypothetical protein